MFGLSKNVTLALVGWLWADILLGLFVIFLAAASAPIPATAASGPSIDPKPIEMKIAVDGARLLSDDQTIATAEGSRIAGQVEQQLSQTSGSRRAAIVFAYGSHQDPVLGEKIARLATQALTGAPFTGAVMKSLHDIVPGDPGTSVALEIYLYQR